MARRAAVAAGRARDRGGARPEPLAGRPAAVPAVMLEYRTPSMLFWKTYHQAIREYIQKNILD